VLTERVRLSQQLNARLPSGSSPGAPDIADERTEPGPLVVGRDDHMNAASVSVNHDELMETHASGHVAVLVLVLGSWVVQLVQITRSE